MPRPKRPEPESLAEACDPITWSELEDVAREILQEPMPEEQHRENREPTPAELEQKFKLEGRR